MICFFEQNQNKRSELFFYAAIALFWGTVELSLPKVIPFFHLGLANLALLLALPRLKSIDFFLLAFLKSLLVSLLNGKLFSLLFMLSLGGTLSSALVMKLLFWKSRYFSLPAISTVGSVVHALTQLMLAHLIYFRAEASFFFLPMLFLSLISGFLLGLIASEVNLPDFFQEMMLEKEVKKKSSTKGIVLWIFFLSCGFLGGFFLFQMKSPLGLTFLAFLMIFLQLALSKKWNFFFSQLGSFFLIFFINQLFPQGEILFRFESVVFADVSLLEGVKKASLFTGLIAYSQILFYLFRGWIDIEGSFSRIFCYLTQFLENPKKFLDLFVPQQSRFYYRLKRSEKKKNRSSSSSQIGKKNQIWLLFFLLTLFSITLYAENRLDWDSYFLSFFRRLQ